MIKIPSLFKRGYKGNRLVYAEVVEGCEWVIEGEGVATEKLDGTACAIIDGVLYKRYDVKKNRKPPANGIPCEPEPDEHTGHCPFWVPVTEAPEDQWHREAFATLKKKAVEKRIPIVWGTYELIGPKIQGNVHGCAQHFLFRHGEETIEAPRTYEELPGHFLDHGWIEGIVWHHPDGRMAKIKRKDFGLPWPPKKEGDGVRFKPVDETGDGDRGDVPGVEAICEEIEENLLRQTTLEAVVDFHDRSLPAVLEAIRLDTPTYYAYQDKIVASIKRAADKWGLTDTASERQIHYLATDAAKDFLDRWADITGDD